MKELIPSSSTIDRLERIYFEMEAAYNSVAAELRFSCQRCPDNCCDSYFLHHTYIEWSYLWVGIAELEPETQKEIIERAREYILASETAIQQDERPQVMCPLNNQGLCLLYKHRLMVCRTHGVPAVISRPDGKQLKFPGCFRCQERVAEQLVDPPHVERTEMLRALAILENEFLQQKRHLYPKVRLTIAQMLVKGPPQLPVSFCER